MAYRFVQGIDYGPRNGTLGIGYHMSEGYDGLPNYLARHSGEDLWEWANRVNGVSCNVAILSTGEKVQMVDWGHAAGNLNPEDRAGEYGYYGGSHLRAVLGDHWTNPNEYSISCELAGFRSVGPTDAQVRSAIEWGLEMRDRYPSIRGSFGHHDQSPKPCPGLTANMRAIFAGVGGHGLFAEQDEPMKPFPVADDPKIAAIKVGAQLYNLDLAPAIKVQNAPGAQSPYGYRTGGIDYRLVEVPTGGVPHLWLVRKSDCVLSEVQQPEPVDCVDEVKAAITADRAKAKVTWA